MADTSLSFSVSSAILHSRQILHWGTLVCFGSHSFFPNNNNNGNPYAALRWRTVLFEGKAILVLAVLTARWMLLGNSGVGKEENAFTKSNNLLKTHIFTLQ
jgi:hypothetical protein